MLFPDLFDRFERVILPSSLSDATISHLRNVAFALDCDAGTRVELDENADHFVFIARGTAKLVAYCDGGREQVVTFHFSNDLVHVPARTRHSFALCALTPMELLAMPGISLRDPATKDSDLVRTACERSIASLIQCRDVTIALGRKSALERVASFLIGMQTRLPSRTDEVNAFDLPMSRSDIADNLGLTIETVSRQFGVLRDREIIDAEGRSLVRVLDQLALARAAGEVPVAA